MITCKIHPLRLFFIVLAIMILATIAYIFHHHSVELFNWINHLGWLAPVLFLLIYCLATLLFLPTMVITLAGGAIFGPILGTLLNLLGAIWGATCSFLITRHLIGDWVTRKKSKKLHQLINEVEQRGWVFIALLRLFPIIPFNLVNYGLGITAIRFRTYLITTAIFLIPPEIIYTYFGYKGMDFLKQGTFYRSSELLIAGLAIVVLIAFKVGQFKVKQFNFRRSKAPVNEQLRDVSPHNESHLVSRPDEYPEEHSS